MKVGVVGVGRLGSLLARALAAHPAVDGLVLAGGGSDRAETLAAELGQRAAASARDAFEATDAAVIAAPTSAHLELIVAAAAAGLPVFCEKPIALDLRDTDAAIEAVERAGVPMQVGFQRRFDAGYMRARRLVRSGALGDVYLLRTASHDPRPSPASFVAASGDLFVDLLIHDFDAMRFVTDQEIEEVHATGEASFAAFDVYRERGDFGVGAAVARMSGGAAGVLTGARHNPDGHDVRMEVFGSRGAVAVGAGERSPLRPVETAGESPPAGPPLAEPYRDFLDRFAPAYRAEMDAFVGLALGESPNPCPPTEARSAFVAALAASRSATENRPVALSELGRPTA